MQAGEKEKAAQELEVYKLPENNNYIAQGHFRVVVREQQKCVFDW